MERIVKGHSPFDADHLVSALPPGGLAQKPGFRMRRTFPTVSGRAANVDPRVRGQLAYLDEQLTRPVFSLDEDGGEGMLLEFLDLPLTPRRNEDRAANEGEFARDSLVWKLRAHDENEGELTLAELLDARNDLTDLRYGFNESLNARWSTLDFNVKAALQYEGVRDLLVSRAALQRGILKVASLVQFVVDHPDGAADVIEYAAASAARALVSEDRLRVPGINRDDDSILLAAVAARPGFSVGSFAPTVRGVVSQGISNRSWDKIIEASKVEVPPTVLPLLVRYLEESTVTVTEENAPFMVPMYLARAATSTGGLTAAGPPDPFAVTFYGDDAAQESINTAAVRCAAQLFYVMVLGDELGVFDTVRYLTQDYLFRDGFAIEDPVLRKDLEDYVFSNRFQTLDARTGAEDKVDATREPVRKAYYRQVFDSGSAPTIADTPPNSEFRRLWKTLMLESARFLERAQVSPHPDNYVSRQNVMQAVEDLQYNLSTTCVGLATVATPMINSELDFVVTRILNHPEVRRHLVPTGGSWLKLVEKMAAARGRRTKATILNNKARIGHALLTSVAEYSAAAFEQDEPFSRFISNVDAFITTSSIVEEFDVDPATPGGPGGGYGGGYGGIPGLDGVPGMPNLADLPGMPANLPGMDVFAGSGNGAGGHHGAGSGSAAPADDWDF
ncbi:hypothetical protein AB0K08_02265 [Citricoccus sp. NPDC055426]|uniref:hypothetical protein n=1 Tax=Citricoccus sp. NPDC055426 TaxID=3155536 RepID=UPI00344566BC